MAEPKKYQYIDSLRGIAILLVILVHASYLPHMTNHLPDLFVRFANNGQYGVQLFFIASAFTLFMSHQNRRGEEHANRNFFIRRFFRIAPMYYLAILYFTFDQYIGFDLSNLDWEAIPKKSLIANVFFLNSISPQFYTNYVPGGWSVSVEFIFYLFVPFLCAKIRNLNSALIFTAISLLFSLACYTIIYQFDYTSDHGFSAFNFPAQLAVFSFGILAYWVMYDKDINIKDSTTLFITFVIFVFCYFTMPYHILYSIIFMMLLITLSKKPFKFFSNRLLARIGRVSFSMYLVHFAIVHLWTKNDINIIIKGDNALVSISNLIIAYLIIAICSYIVSYGSYRFIEVPGQNLGKRIINKLDQSKISN